MCYIFHMLFARLEEFEESLAWGGSVVGVEFSDDGFDLFNRQTHSACYFRWRFFSFIAMLNFRPTV